MELDEVDAVIDLYLGEVEVVRVVEVVGLVAEDDEGDALLVVVLREGH